MHDILGYISIIIYSSWVLLFLPPSPSLCLSLSIYSFPHFYQGCYKHPCMYIIECLQFFCGRYSIGRTSSSSTVPLSWGCRNKHQGWGIRSLAVLEAGSLTSRCSHGHAPSETLPASSHFLVVAVKLWCPFVYSCGIMISASILMWCFVYLPLCLLLSCKDTSHIGLKVYLSTMILIYILIAPTKTLFPNKVQFTGTGVRTSIYLLGGCNKTTTNIYMLTF